jgi:hypothetical protein
LEKPLHFIQSCSLSSDHSTHNPIQYSTGVENQYCKAGPAYAGLALVRPTARRQHRHAGQHHRLWSATARKAFQRVRRRCTGLFRLTVPQCLHYALTCDPDVTLLAMSVPIEQDAAFTAAKSFGPLSEKQMADSYGKVALAIGGKGPCWWNP